MKTRKEGEQRVTKKEKWKLVLSSWRYSYIHDGCWRKEEWKFDIGNGGTRRSLQEKGRYQQWVDASLINCSIMIILKTCVVVILTCMGHIGSNESQMALVTVYTMVTGY